MRLGIVKTIEIFENLDLNNITVTKMPELPKIQWKHGNVTYTATDVRYLNEIVEHMILTIIEVLSEYEIGECKFGEMVTYTVDITNMDEKSINAISTAIPALNYKRKQKNTEICGSLLVTGIIRHGSALDFTINPDIAKDVFQYARYKSGEINYFKLVEYLADSATRRLTEWMEKKEQ